MYPKTLLLVPVYNEYENLSLVADFVIQQVKLGIIDTVLFVDDASTDRSGELLQKHMNDHIQYYRFSKNKGKGAAFIYGLQKAIDGGYRRLFMMDSDMLHTPVDMYRDIHDALTIGAIMTILPAYEGARDRKLPHSVDVSGQRGMRINPFLSLIDRIGRDEFFTMIGKSRYGLEVALNALINRLVPGKIDILQYEERLYYPLTKPAWRQDKTSCEKQEKDMDKILSWLHGKLPR